MPTIFGNDNGTLREPSDWYGNDNGALRQLKEIWGNDNGTLRLLWAASSIDWGGSDVTANFVTNIGGTNGGSLVHSGNQANVIFDPDNIEGDILNTWTDSGTTFGDYEVRLRSINSANLPASGSPINTWLNAGTPRSWTFNGANNVVQTFEWEYRLAGNDSSIVSRLFILSFQSF